MFKEKEDGLRQEDINELYYILPIENLESVLKNGLLSNKRSLKLKKKPKDISNNDVQKRRETLVLRAKPKGDKAQLRIHQHVNFYLNPHNAMMFNMFNEKENICVLRIHKELLKRGDGILSTQNSATNAASFFKSADWHLEKDKATHLVSPYSLPINCKFDDPMTNQWKQTRQAEALFPRKVPCEFIGDIFVCSNSAMEKVKGILAQNNKTSIPIETNTSIFFEEKKNLPLELYKTLEPLSEEACQKLDFKDPSSSEDEDQNNGEHFTDMQI